MGLAIEWIARSLGADSVSPSRVSWAGCSLLGLYSSGGPGRGMKEVGVGWEWGKMTFQDFVTLPFPGL